MSGDPSFSDGFADGVIEYPIPRSAFFEAVPIPVQLVYFPWFAFAIGEARNHVVKRKVIPIQVWVVIPNRWSLPFEVQP